MTDDLTPDLVRQALATRGGAARSLFKALTPVIHARVARVLLLRRPHTAGRDIRRDIEDLTQEILLVLVADDGKVLRSWNPERGMNLRNFVGMVAERRTTSYLRSRRRNPWTEEPTDFEESSPPAAGSGPEERAATRQLADRLLDRLQESLSPMGWQMFEHFFVDELSAEEVIERTGLSADAVYAWRSRLRRKARELARKLSAETPQAMLSAARRKGE